MGTTATGTPGGSNGTESGTPAGTAPGAAGATGAGTGGTGGGTGTPAGSGQGGGTGTLDRSKLAEPLRNLSEEQLNSVVDTMFQALSRREASGTPPTEAPPPRQPDPEPNWNEYFDPASDKFNPKAAMAQFVERNYAPLIGDISRRAVQGSFVKFREEFPDFKDYEGDVSKALQTSGIANPSDAQIMGVYFAAKGQRAALEERNKRTKAQSSPPPSAANVQDDKPTEAPLDDDEKVVARRLFPNATDPEKMYRDYAKRLEQADTTMKVPMGGGVRR